MSDEGRQPPQMPSYDPMQWAPQPPPAPPARHRGRKALIIIGIIVLALAVLGAGGYLLIRGVLRSAEKLGAQVAEPVLVQLRGGNYDAVYDGAAPEFQQAITKVQFKDFMGGFEKSVGRPQSWTLVGYETNAYAGTGGAMTVRTFNYDVVNEHGHSEVSIQLGKENRLLHLNMNPTAK